MDGKLAYFATADILADRHGGLHAVDLESGRQVWHYPPPRPDCVQTVGCSEAQSAALSAIPGVVFTGAADGSIRAHASADGKLLWSHASNREYQTVNDVVARGGSIDGAGPVIAGGMLYVASGNGGMVGMRGNVLLAFGIREDTDSE
jgi:polyvinyl alcohol dehydrogenase (cytochrome)